MLNFVKYQGAGNDFILIDNRDKSVSLNTAQIAFLCDRRFGIGADGLMLLELTDGFDFKMVYFNSDGNESTMCGNGGRCIVAFAARLGVIKTKTIFLAIDGSHAAEILENGNVQLKMQDVESIKLQSDIAILNTGSPHYIQWVPECKNVDVFGTGRSIRNKDEFQPKGINVNFVERANDNKLIVRTYERGVEDETLSCGTGVTAAAIASSGTATGTFNYDIETPGGALNVQFEKHGQLSARNVYLTGPAVQVFEGAIEV